MIESATELYVHAIAIEREAAGRYAEFAARMADQGHEELAAVFAKLAVFEAEHLEALERRTVGVQLPVPASDYTWLEPNLVLPVETPRQVIAIALEAEKRAREFFAHVQRIAGDPALRALAKEMAAEEDGHIALLEHAMTRAHDPFVDWESIFEGPEVQR